MREGVGGVQIESEGRYRWGIFLEHVKVVYVFGILLVNKYYEPLDYPYQSNHIYSFLV